MEGVLGLFLGQKQFRFEENSLRYILLIEVGTRLLQIFKGRLDRLDSLQGLVVLGIVVGQNEQQFHLVLDSALFEHLFKNRDGLDEVLFCKGALEQLYLHSPFGGLFFLTADESPLDCVHSDVFLTLEMDIRIRFVL